MSRPLILHVTTVPMSLTFLRGQVGYMMRNGFAVEAASSPGTDLEAFSRSEGVKTFAIPMERRITPLNDLSAVWALRRLIADRAPTVVHAHTPKGGLLGMIAAVLGRAPIRVYHMRGLAYQGATGVKRKLLMTTERIACGLAHRVVCVSHSIRAEAMRDRICSARKITVIAGGSGNGVDSGGRFDPERLRPEARQETRVRFGIPGGAAVIGFVGRLVRDKGIVELSDAWAGVRERYPEAHLLLVGPFEPTDPVPARIREALKSDPRVHLVGMDWDTPPLYAAMDVVVLPTYREGFPNVPLEAAAMGLPVVATRVPGCVDAVLDGVTGTLIAPNDAVALADAIERYLGDPGLRFDHGSAGQSRVRAEFSREVIWAGLLEIYRQELAVRGILDPPNDGTAGPAGGITETVSGGSVR
jgi:glycosyltransferase involved in cell wall biosynthesis